MLAGLSSTMRISSFAMTHRKRERERRAHTLLALHPDPTPVELDELPTQGQPQPRAFDLLRRSDLAELLEDLLLILRGNPDPGVADGDLGEPIFRHGRDFDSSAFRRELDCVR